MRPTNLRLFVIFFVFACGDSDKPPPKRENPPAAPDLERELARNPEPDEAPDKASDPLDVPACREFRDRSCDCSDVPRQKELCRKADESLARTQKTLAAKPDATGQADETCRRLLNYVKAACP